MPTPTKGPRLGGSPAHERIILANLASQLFEHGRITTTEAKAKRVRPLAEKLISKAKRGDLHSRRLVLQTITDKSVVHTLFTVIAPAMADRDGGYVRITKVGNRKGDNAPMAVIEIVSETVEQSRAAKSKVAKKAAGKVATKATKPSKVEDKSESTSEKSSEATVAVEPGTSDEPGPKTESHDGVEGEVSQAKEAEATEVAKPEGDEAVEPGTQDEPK